jgi:amidase
MAMSDLDRWLDATALAELVRRREVHPRELAEDAIARIEATDRDSDDGAGLNAVVHRRFERALADIEQGLPDGPFRGVPFLLKDYGAEQAGEPHHQGMAHLRGLDWRADADGLLTAAFRAAGLVILGRTNVPEMALMGTTEPVAAGPTRNPWDRGRSPGGSSGGSAAAVSAGMVPAAHANDIAGSIRIPAAHCGLVGLKPTRGRVRTGPDADPPVGLFVEGVVTRSLRDTAALLDTIAAPAAGAYWPAPPLPGPLTAELGRSPGRLRVALCLAAPTGSEVEPGCAEAAAAAGRLLEGLGHEVVDAAPRALFDPTLFEGARAVLAATASQVLGEWERRTGTVIGEDEVEPTTWAAAAAGRAMSGPELLRWLCHLQLLARAITGWWAESGVDVLLTPTTAAPPTVLGEYLRGYEAGRGSAFTRPFNVTGQPALSLPLGWPADGLPRGVQLVAELGREDLLVRVGAQIEEAAPWASRHPVDPVV